MIYGFDTDDPAAATGALLLYATWRSRDARRFEITPDLWGRIERFVKAAAKRAQSIPQFIDALKPRLACATLNPRWMEVGMRGEVPLVPIHDPDTGAIRYILQPAADAGQREFLTRVLAGADAASVLHSLYRETAWVVLLVRDRLERERPIEARLDIDADDTAEVAA